MPKNKTLIGLWVAALSLFATVAWGHSGSTAYLELSVDEQQLDGEWWLALEDLEVAIGLDGNLDDHITYGEFKQQQPTLLNYARQHIQVLAGDEVCALQWRVPTLSRVENSTYAQLSFTTRCSSVSALRYGALFTVDDNHRAIVELSRDGRESVLVFSPNDQQQSLQITNVSAWRTVFVYVEQGVIHILEGYDHLLFLLALLVPIVISGGGRGQDESQSILQLSTALLKVITAFTLGHSITLILATVFLASPPIAWVETIIALSVILAGVNIVVPIFRESCWKIAVMFGLVHGFGFASVLSQLSLDRGNLFVSLLSFNVGVELGQLLVVLVVTPVLVLLARGKIVPSLARYGAAGMVAVIGVVWVVERIPV